MKQHSNTNEAAANERRAMKSGNGESPKSLKSRGNFLNRKAFAFFVAALIGIGLTGCSKDNGDKNEANKPYLMTEVVHKKDHKTMFKYDDKNRITKWSVYYGNDYTGTLTLTYNSIGDVVSVRREIHKDGDVYRDTIKFIRNDNIITVSGWHTSGEFYYIDTLEVNARGQLLKVMAENTYDDGDWNKTVYTYQYQGRNLIGAPYEREEYRKGEIEKKSFMRTYSYDDKKGVFYHCETPDWFLRYWFFVKFGIQNNVKTESDWFISAYEYTYNDAGFPLTCGITNYKYNNSWEQVIKSASHETPSDSDVDDALPERNIWDHFSPMDLTVTPSMNEFKN